MRKLLVKLALVSSVVVANGFVVTAEENNPTDTSEPSTVIDVSNDQNGNTQPNDEDISKEQPEIEPGADQSQQTDNTQNVETIDELDSEISDEGTETTETTETEGENQAVENIATYKLDVIPSESINDYITRISEYINQDITDDEKRIITQVIFSYRVSDNVQPVNDEEDLSNDNSEQGTPITAEHDVRIDDLAYSGDGELILFKLTTDELVAIPFEQNGSGNFSVNFHDTAGDFMLVAAGEQKTDEIETLAPNALVTIEEGTETPAQFEAMAASSAKEIYDAANAYMQSRYRILLRPIMIEHITFEESESINLHEEYVFDAETKEQVSIMTGGTVRMKASNIDYDLKNITYFETIWVSEDMTEAAITNHSVFGNDIYFTMNKKGYLIAAEVEWTGTPESESSINSETPLLFNMSSIRNLLRYAPAKISGINKLNSFNALAAPTTDNNATVTVVWQGDTVGTRAASSTVHIIHGLLTVNGVAPDANGNVNVACVYGTEASTKDTCFTVESDVPADVDWDALNSQADKIAEIKQKLGIE